MTPPSIGTAGWSIPASVALAFPPAGSTLERYASRFRCVEVNSSFHRPHRISTWQRWRESTPPDFRFSVKVPKRITHQLKLVGCEAALAEFLMQSAALGEKLAVLLVQLPPSLAFDSESATTFFAGLAGNTHASVVCEPRHVSWFGDEADSFLADQKVSRVAADPALCAAAAFPGGSPNVRYWRLHGSPVIYRSSYADRLDTYADLLRYDATIGETWCIFDNTASSAATQDALALVGLTR